MNIDMTLNTQRNNFQWLRVIGVMILPCLIYVTARADKFFGRLYLFITNRIAYNSLCMKFFGIFCKARFIMSRVFNSSNFCLCPYSLFLIYSISIIFSPFREGGSLLFSMLIIPLFSTIFTLNTITIFMGSVFPKFIQIFILTAFRTLLFHFTPQRKMPAASWSSTKRQAGNILAHNTLARPTVFDLVNYSI